MNEGFPAGQEELLTQSVMFVIADAIILVVILFGLVKTTWRFRCVPEGWAGSVHSSDP